MAIQSIQRSTSEYSPRKHVWTHAKHRIKDHDFATVARRVVEQAIGEQLDGSPLPDPNAGKNPVAWRWANWAAQKVAGHGRRNCPWEKRKQIAKKAAKARWNYKKTK
jgi:hypothetical protein